MPNAENSKLEALDAVAEQHGLPPYSYLLRFSLAFADEVNSRGHLDEGGCDRNTHTGDLYAEFGELMRKYGFWTQ